MNPDSKILGFWIYLMTDLIVFAVLFAAYLVLKNNTFGGPSAYQLFSMPNVVAETLILLTSSFTCSLATYFTLGQKKHLTIFWFAATFVLGCIFLYLELSEFSLFFHSGATPQRSAFLSSFFTLVGTHGFHIFIGLIWILVTIFTIGFRGLSQSNVSKIFRLAYFWHFLDVIWIFIFTIVYAMGHIYA